MIRKFALAASAVALAASGIGVAAASPAFAGKPTVTAGAGSHISCKFSASVKLKPPLKDNWVKADHTGDSVAAVRNLPNTTFAPVTSATSGKATTVAGTCGSSFVTAGSAQPHYTVTKMQITLTQTHASSTENSCRALVNETGPGTARYTAVIKYTATGAKVTATTITNADIAPDTALPGFDVENGTISGSFAGGSSLAKAAIDNATLGVFAPEVVTPYPTSTHPDPYDVCQPTLKMKTKNGVTTASLKAPKGMKAIGIDPTHSTITLSR